jgi:hypothetical protein
LHTPSLCPPRGNPAHSGSETGSGSCRVAYPCTATQPLHGTDQCGGWEQLALFLQKRELVLRLLPQDTVPLCPPVPPSALGLDGKPRLCRWERVAKSCGSSVSWHGMCVWCSSSWGGVCSLLLGGPGCLLRTSTGQGLPLPAQGSLCQTLGLAVVESVPNAAWAPAASQVLREVTLGRSHREYIDTPGTPVGYPF